MKSLSVLVFICSLLFCSFSYGSEKFVLMLHSYHQGYGWADEVQKGIVQEFSSKETILKINYRVEYMNSFDLKGKSFDDSLIKLYKQKYPKAPDLIMAIDNMALEFLKKHRLEIWGERPVVFCGINNFTESLLNGFSEITGVVEDIPYFDTLKLALDFDPQTKHYVFLYNASIYENDIIELIKNINKDFPQVKFHYIADPSFPSIIKSIEQIGENTSVFLLGVIKNEQGENLSVALGTNRLHHAVKNPLFSFSEQYLGHGIIGGRFLNGQEHGQQAANLAFQVLSGADILNIPVLRKTKALFAFDAKELDLKGISQRHLPRNHYLVNDGYEFLKKNEVLILSTTGMILFLLVACIFLFIYFKDRKKILISLHEKNERLSSLTSNIPHMAFYRARSDDSQGVLFVSETIHSLTGFSKREIQDLAQIIYNDDKVYVKAERERQILKEKSFEIDYRVLCRDGSLKYIKEKGQVVETLDGKVIDGVLMDITLIKNLEREKHQIQNQLFQSARLASVGTLAAGVAHEINNPLAILQGYFDIIKKTLDKRGLLDHHLKDYFVTGLQSLDRIATIANGLRVFAKSDLDHYGPVNIHRVIEDTAGLCLPIFQKVNITFDYKLDAPFSLIHGNEGKLQQVVMNLLTNARDGILESERKLEGVIKIETSLVNGLFYLKIEDNGAGIPREYLQRVFDPFFTTKVPGKGIGLGLSIVHSIIELMNGGIQLQSIQNKGTVITISLPLSLSIAHEIRGHKIENQSEKKTFTNKSALVIDDEEGMRRVLKSYLEDFGLAVSEASNGKEALESFQSHVYDYVFVDHHMPQMDGIEFLEAFDFAEHPQTSTKFFFMTGGFAEEVLSPEMKEHIHGHLPKPFTEEALERLLREK